MALAVTFQDVEATNPALVGGKGANLGRLTAGSFPVPDGFTVTTEGYRAFIRHNSLGAQMAALIGAIDFADAGSVDTVTAKIRELIVGSALPEKAAAQIAEAYAALGDEVRVAIRSSGTAEDLEGASFAGQHDTYLHIRGGQDVVDAVKRCWASLWTSRATAYRQHLGFAQDAVSIAVVVQIMVDADVSGVMFTANPIIGATNEMVINASYGLGETVVSGIVTPDSFILDTADLRVKYRTLGAKEEKIRLDDAQGQGTVHEEVPAAERAIYCLSERQIRELGDLGRRVMAHYEGFPQDTEWAIADGSIYLLQSRPVTGADLSWDEGVEDWQVVLDDPDTVWSRAMTDEGWTGGITPLFYSIRGKSFDRGERMQATRFGWKDTARLRYMRYHKGSVYFSTRTERDYISRVLPPHLRPLGLAYTSALDHEVVLGSPFSYVDLVRLLARVHALAPEHGFRGSIKVQKDYIDNRCVEAAGMPDEKLRLLEDAALVAEAERGVEFDNQYVEDIYSCWMFNFTNAARLYIHLLSTWYDGGNANVVTDLLTGVTTMTATAHENLALWELAGRIRSSTELSTAFREHRNGAFFEAISESEEGAAFLAEYRAFVEEYGHRGHADRDIFYIRRAEDHAVSYRALGAMLTADADHDPTAAEHNALTRKRAAQVDVRANLATKPLGFLRVEVFSVLDSYLQGLLEVRDDQRAFIDISTFATKRAYKEIGRRLVDRGVLDGADDFYFLSTEELYRMFRGTERNVALTKTKIAGRRRNFDKVHQREALYPFFLRDGRAVEIVTAEEDDGTLKGLTTSGGVVTGTARVVKNLEHIDRLQKGDILVCHATDPGWTPVFLIISGAVFETGGPLAHCSCLSREYGLPAIQLQGACRRIPDGATITVDGNTGRITVHDEEPAEI
jgi:pyruvate,water dikinase